MKNFVTRVAALPAAFAVALSPAAALAETVTLVSHLTGANETAGGDPDGSGEFTVDVDADSGDFCFTLTGAKLDKPTMAHVHSGAAGADGPPVITIAVATDECVAAEPDVLKPIVAAPENYYVNIHTEAFPKGAVRGQLMKKP